MHKGEKYLKVLVVKELQEKETEREKGCRLASVKLGSLVHYKRGSGGWWRDYKSEKERTVGREEEERKEGGWRQGSLT